VCSHVGLTFALDVDSVSARAHPFTTGSALPQSAHRYLFFSSSERARPRLDYLRRWPSEVSAFWQTRCIATGQMLPSSHEIPMHALMTAPQIAETQLTDAFTAFIGAANRLEDSHRQLHDEVASLRKQLEERNRALASSVAETERMRIAVRQILDALPCGVAVLDTQREEVVLLNPEARRLLDITDQTGWSNLPECLQTPVKAVSRELQDQGYEQEVIVGKDGRNVWLNIHHSIMTNPASETRRNDSPWLVLIVTDVTAHKNAEQEREKSRNVVALAEMATVLAHEIRNPLGSMELLTSCLAGDPALSEESKHSVQHLRAGLRSLSATVNNVLCFHSPGTQPMSPLELGSVLKVSVEFIRPLAQQRGVNLTLRETLNQAEIAGDTNGLRQLILNLACNALRHTQLGGEITIAAAVEVNESGRTAVVEFADNGSGIRPEDLPHIFKLGFTTTGQTPGLGLTVCQRIVEQHLGTMGVRSQLGKGATFRLEFPIL
jgi:two-component system sensor histidine kinase FlrB